MVAMYRVYLTPQEWALLQNVLDTAIEHYEEYGYRKEEIATIHLKDSIKDSYEMINI